MKVLENTLALLIDTWDDPGDYPNTLADKPLPSYEYVEGMEGEYVVELTSYELHALLVYLVDHDEEITGWVENEIDPSLPDGILSVRWWSYTLDSNKLTLWSEDVEVDPDYNPHEEDGEGAYEDYIEDKALMEEYERDMKDFYK